MCGDAGGSNCQYAVQRAWDGLLRLGADEVSAFRACTTLYLIRHPAASVCEARDLVAEWLDHAERDP
jgi:hypothetical protein